MGSPRLTSKKHILFKDGSKPGYCNLCLCRVKTLCLCRVKTVGAFGYFLMTIGGLMSSKVFMCVLGAGEGVEAAFSKAQSCSLMVQF